MASTDKESYMEQETTRTYTLDAIEKSIEVAPLIEAIEEGFRLYSEGKTVVPPVGHLQLESPPGDVHIKYGYIEDDEVYVIKIASGFYENPKRGLPSSNGMMLVFSQETGVAEAILLDEGYLTDVRTGIAGAVAAKHLAPSKVEAIGIVGTGTQARLQLRYLKEVTDCRKAVVWGRGEEQLETYTSDMKDEGFDLTATQDMSELTSTCNLIVTTTRAFEPLIEGGVRKGTHITAVGADMPGKQELATQVVSEADQVIVDSKDQCIDHGEIEKAVKDRLLDPNSLVELGSVIGGQAKGRENDKQITVADLTGVAVQDVQIAKFVSRKLRN